MREMLVDILKLQIYSIKSFDISKFLGEYQVSFYAETYTKKLHTWDQYNVELHILLLFCKKKQMFYIAPKIMLLMRCHFLWLPYFDLYLIYDNN